jgi:hypothetical protein
MVSWRVLLDAAHPLDAGQTDKAFLGRSVAALGGVKLPVRVGPAFRYPKPTELGRLREVLEETAASSSLDALLLTQLLRRPWRTYPLTGPEAAFALIGSWRIDDQVEPRIAVLRPQTGGLTLDIAAYDVGASHNELVSAMEALYVDLDTAARRAPEPTRGVRDRVLWLGGSDAETGDPTWRSRIEAMLIVEGYEGIIRERPGRDSRAVARAVSEFAGTAVVCWVPRLGNLALAESIRQRTSLRVIDLNEYEFGDARAELRLILDDEPLASPASDDDATGVSQFESGTRYYFKKVAKRGQGVDLMIHRRNACGHESWTVAHKAPQARKGIEHVAQRSIRKLEHCDRCTGGGMWRVVFV